MNKVKIVLPETIYINKMIKNQKIHSFSEEYTVYFKNIIQPYNPMWNIQVKCDYGQNLGEMWRIANFEEDINSFDFEIFVYDEYCEFLVSKKCKIVMVDRKLQHDETNLLAIGNSMTFAEEYLQQVQTKLVNVKTQGTRSVNKTMYYEGRGGWTCPQYFGMIGKKDEMSPFLFPKDVDGELYYGCMEFMEELKTENSSSYPLIGFSYEPIREGMYFLENKKLYIWKNGKGELIDENPEFEFDFDKYMKRYNLKNIDIVSILVGTNDLKPQKCEPENFVSQTEELIKGYMEYLRRFVENIHYADRDIKIIINPPLHGGEQYTFGKREGCGCGAKVYRHIIMRAAERIIEEFDNRQDENIFVCPMMATIDPEYGWNHNYVRANLYSDHHRRVQTDGIHPNHAGYCQIGDALASVVEYIR